MSKAFDKPESWWKRTGSRIVKFLAGIGIVGVLLGYYYYRQQSFAALSSRVGSGDVAAVQELARFGGKAVPVLVRSIDPVGGDASGSKNWPEQTLAIISALQGAELSTADKQHLASIARKGHLAIDKALIEARSGRFADYNLLKQRIDVNQRIHALDRASTPPRWPDSMRDLCARTSGVLGCDDPSLTPPPAASPASR